MNLADHTNAIAQYLPNGKTFEAKNIGGSNLRQLLRGLAGEFKTAQDYLTTIEAEYFPDETTLYIDEWESAVGIPDSCFSGTGTIEERRRNVIIKLAALGVQTAADFVALGALFGITVEVHGGRYFNQFPLVFPVLLFDTVKESRFTIVVDFTVEAASQFPLTFPFTFGDETIGTLECLFRRLKPANCDIIFRQV